MTEKRFTVLAADKLTAFLEVERQVLTQAETSIGPAGTDFILELLTFLQQTFDQIGVGM